MENTKSFDHRLRNILILSGVCREELACHLGVSVPVVNRWLNGFSAPDVYQFQSIANYFGMPYEWFLEVGDGFPSAEELAARLGLSVDTVEGLLALAESESTDVPDLLDDAIYAMVSAINAVYDGLLRTADNAMERATK